MSLFTVQAPVGLLGKPEFERAILLRDGFSWGAFFLGAIWLIWQGLWLVAAAWLAAEALLVWSALTHLGFGSFFFIALAMRIFLGLEGNAMLRRKLARRHYCLVDVVNAAALVPAERLFFSRLALPVEPAQGKDVPPPPPPPPVPPQNADVLGVFPEPETKR
jgi:hypothetical protein